MKEKHTCMFTLSKILCVEQRFFKLISISESYKFLDCFMIFKEKKKIILIWGTKLYILDIINIKLGIYVDHFNRFYQYSINNILYKDHFHLVKNYTKMLESLKQHNFIVYFLAVFPYVRQECVIWNQAHFIPCDTTNSHNHHSFKVQQQNFNNYKISLTLFSSKAFALYL